MRIPLLSLVTAFVLVGCGGARPGAESTLSIDTGALSPQATVVANAQSQPELSNLVSALQSAGLVSALNGDGPFTVFAPINSAFDGVDAASMSRDELAAVLQYHVVSGDVSANDLVDGMVLGTLQGENITVSFRANDQSQVVLDGDAIVIYPDIEASNGRIHLINGLLTPTADGVTSIE